jgi:hypothetical protein
MKLKALLIALPLSTLVACSQPAPPQEPVATTTPEAQPAAPEPVKTDPRVEAAVELPAEAIRAVRIQPIVTAGTSVVFESATWTDAAGSQRVPICDDKRLELVRTQRTSAPQDAECVLTFGTSDGNTGWIGPKMLKEIPAADAPRRLDLAIRGELTGVRVYWDTGSGYNNREMAQVGVAKP